VPGSVVQLWHHPAKSMQGTAVSELQFGPAGAVGDRSWGLLDVATGKLASAKRFSTLLDAHGHAEGATLPDGRAVALHDPDADAVLSGWLGREVRVVRATEGRSLTYEMTFDPPDDDAELFDIPTPTGTLLDLAPVHLVTVATLERCRSERPDLDWDVRRFRPNLVVDLDAAPFAEDDWRGRHLAVGAVVLRVRQPTVRCAMPLRAQPGGLERQPELFRALSTLNPIHPNHLGVYLDVVEPGTVREGDPAELR
jgi:uncharacterized protein